ncbi:hypothetical protein ANANG_G00111030 [Anguilla anguilla]|uniref:Uncharacterized protein n=1 Tax=Anguilla anguilla TaxID=7936 RepID=A0A9D3S208_ANGAN|nr:hypothetical protein ANANG_G00111030 [Anguilla anguilla]
MASPESGEWMGLLASLDPPVPKETKVKRVLMVSPDPRDHKEVLLAHLDQMVSQGYGGRKGTLVREEKRGSGDLKVKRVIRASLVWTGWTPRANWVQMVCRCQAVGRSDHS